MESCELRSQSTPLLDFYRQKVVFITGGTGFIGKLIIEKLLRINVRQIVLLSRPKRGRTIEERLEEIFSGPVFAKLLQTNPDLTSYVKLIDGDLQKPYLGLSKDTVDYLIEETQIVLHAAADVRFDQSLKKAVEVNVRGTRDLMRIAERMKKLEAITYVSTAYSNCPLSHIREQFYDPPTDPDKMIAFVESMDEKMEEEINTITKQFIAPWPNTYVYSKSLTEEIVRKFGDHLPISIVRPSIIVATNEEPIPGWCDNIYGLNGVVAGVGLGIIRVMYIQDNQNCADIIPADFVVNTVIVSAWQTHRERILQGKSKMNGTLLSSYPNDDASIDYANVEASEQRITAQAKIYNCVCTSDNPISYESIYKLSLAVGKSIPPRRSLWVVCHNLVSFRCAYLCLRFLYHTIPAHIIDAYLRLIKRTPRVVNLYQKVHKFSDVTDYFANRRWTFENVNTKELVRQLTKEDQKIFRFDVRNFKWENFFDTYIYGLRRYIGNEPDGNLVEARVRYQRMIKTHYIMLGTFYGLLFYFVYNIFKWLGFIFN